MPSVAKQIRYQIEALAVRGIAKLIPLLPRPAVLALADALGGAAYVFDRRGRETGLANVRAAMAAGALPRQDPHELVKGSYRYFARSMCDLFWATHLDAENYTEHIQVEFEDPAGFRRAAKGGALWVTPHYGNFEWLSLVMAFRGHLHTLIAQDFKNPQLTELFTRGREISGHKVIPSRRAMVRLLKTLRGGGNAALLTDLNVPPDTAAVPIRCFSMITSVTALHPFIATRTGKPIVPCICIPCSDGSYVMKMGKPFSAGASATLSDVAQRCWDIFEADIRAFPEPWLWMYKHWRYRPEGEDGERYPEYANRSKKFDKWLRG